jgi:hypothetical protein
MELPLRSAAIKLKEAISRVIKITAKKQQQKNSEKTEGAMWGGRSYDRSDVSCFL